VAGIADGVNCDEADAIGSVIQANWNNMSVSEVTLRKIDQVMTMAQLSNSVSVQSEKVNIDPYTLFHHLITAGERCGKLQDCFEYELTPYPMSLFKSGLMRKPDKAGLYRDFVKDLTYAAKPSQMTYVMDGGYMLHKVRWFPMMHVADVLSLYVRFVQGYGLNATVVFDGYGSGPSIKDQEHARRSLRSGQVAQDRQINKETTNIGNQEMFLSNTKNKMALISLLADTFFKQGISVHQAQGDADTVIVAVALNKAQRAPVAVLAEDTDILALLLYHCSNSMTDILFISEPKRGRGNKSIAGKCINVREVQQKN
jgi:hypothetical protein